MQTHFASPQRTSPTRLRAELSLVTNHPMLDGLMRAVDGLVAVVDDNRQIVTTNTIFLSMLGVKNPHEVLGLRPGEALNCIHAHEMSAGCGTSEFCSTCGAAIALVTSVMTNEVVEKGCVLEVEKSGVRDDLYLKVRASPITVGGQRFTLLFMVDLSVQQQWACLERVFFTILTMSLMA